MKAPGNGDEDPMDDDAGSDGGSEEGEEGEAGEEDDDDAHEDGEDDESDDGPGAGMKLAACSVDFDVGFFSDRASGTNHVLLRVPPETLKGRPGHLLRVLSQPAAQDGRGGTRSHGGGVGV